MGGIKRELGGGRGERQREGDYRVKIGKVMSRKVRRRGRV